MLPFTFLLPLGLFLLSLARAQDPSSSSSSAPPPSSEYQSSPSVSSSPRLADPTYGPVTVTVTVQAVPSPSSSSSSSSSIQRSTITVLETDPFSPFSTFTSAFATSAQSSIAAAAAPTPSISADVHANATLASNSAPSDDVSLIDGPDAPTPDFNNLTIADTTQSNAAAQEAAARYGSNYTIVVGGTSGMYVSPPNMNAIPVNSTITFEFHSTNYSVVRSTSFLDPCMPLVGDGAFDSGFQFFDANDSLPDASTAYPTFNFSVKDTNPIYFYCPQFDIATNVTHCGSGMVGVINVNNATEGYMAFRARAIAVNGTFSPTARMALKASVVSSGFHSYGLYSSAMSGSQFAIFVLGAWTAFLWAAGVF